jgi:ring-1,2-phenylacetyl-CoA epoxidase subunit PaaE
LLFEPERQNYAAFAAGSGIDSVLSILQNCFKNNEPKSTFVVIYGNKSPEELFFHQKFCTIYNSNIQVVFL